MSLLSAGNQYKKVAVGVTGLFKNGWTVSDKLSRANDKFGYWQANGIATNDSGLMVVVGNYSRCSMSTDGNTWTYSPGLFNAVSGTTASATPNMNSIIWDGTRFVAAGSSSLVAYSQDAITWVVVDTSASMGAGRTYRKIAYAAGTYVVVGDSGAIGYSTDLINWTNWNSALVTAGMPSTLNINSLTRFNNMWVIIAGTAPTIYTAYFNTSWTVVSNTVAWTGGNTILGLANSGTNLVAAASGNYTCKSLDGITWTFGGALVNIGPVNILYGSSVFMVVGSLGINVSIDNGTSWTRRLYNTSNAVAFGHYSTNLNKYFIFGYDLFSFAAYGTLPGGTIDLTNNLTGYGDSFGGRLLSGVVWHVDRFVATNTRCLIGTTTDGVNWSVNNQIAALTVSGVETGFFGAPATNAGLVASPILMVGVGLSATYAMYSADSGVTWNKVTIPAVTVRPAIAAINGGTNNGKFIITDGVTATMVNADGSGYVALTSPSSYVSGRVINAVYARNNLICIVTANSLVYSTNGGSTWSASASYVIASGAVSINSVASNGTIIVGVGNSGRFVYSSDGINWSGGSFPYTVALYAVIWDGTQFMAVSSLSVIAGASTIYTSPDGITWTADQSITKITSWFKPVLASPIAARLAYSPTLKKYLVAPANCVTACSN